VTIDLLCKVVDNYGDIGVVYRLARSLSEQPEAPRLRLIVDDLQSFACLEPGVDPRLDVQSLCGWELYRWGASEAALQAFREEPPEVVLECFACGRPDWLESLLFDEGGGRDCLIVELDYLTAEAFAAEFHRMPSLTRSASVRKAMFFPGFSAGTGGLTLDRAFSAAREASREPDAGSGIAGLGLRSSILARLGAMPLPSELPADAADRFWVSLFSYERDYGAVVADLAAYAAAAGSAPASARKGLLVFAAAGRSQACVISAWEAAGRPFDLVALPFLPQGDWDELLLSCDFSIVRGEESWSRASLSGRAFLWQAYPQEQRHQMVKVEAFLARIEPYFEAGDFALLADAYRELNDRDRDSPGERGHERLLPLLERSDSLSRAFRAFSDSLAPLGDLGSNLLTFLREIV
jgi:uncharacterized repeat protein (TIGR03837 family)